MTEFRWTNVGVFQDFLSEYVSAALYIMNYWKFLTILDLLIAERDFLFVWILNVISYRSQNPILQGSVALNVFTFFGSASFSIAT